MSAARITLITAPHCELCQHAKEVLARVGADYDIEVSVLSDESERGSALMMEHLVAFPPGVLLDEKLFSYGRLSERKLRRQLDKTGAARPRPKGGRTPLTPATASTSTGLGVVTTNLGGVPPGRPRDQTVPPTSVPRP